MFSRNWKRVFADLKEVRAALQEIEHRNEMIQTILTVREPSSVAAGDAYEGLRRQVVNAVSDRTQHLSHLVQMDRATPPGPAGDTLRELIALWFEQVNLLRLTDAGDSRAEALFDLIDDQGGPLEVVEPAYVDGVSGRLIRRGKARALAIVEHSRHASAQENSYPLAHHARPHLFEENT